MGYTPCKSQPNCANNRKAFSPLLRKISSRQVTHKGTKKPNAMPLVDHVPTENSKRLSKAAGAGMTHAHTPVAMHAYRATSQGYS